MKKAFTYSALVLLLAATACNKTESVSLGESGIRFAPASVDTRALIENEAGLQQENFHVYDFLNGAMFIDESILYASGAWNYISENTYTWDSGTHKFFGFTEDVAAFNETAKTLTVNRTITTDEPSHKQWDILYSEIFTTTAAAWKSNNTVDTPVALHMKHLFSAVSIMVKNCTEEAVTVNSLTPNIPNQGSAVIDYSGDAVSVQYTAPVVSTTEPFIANPIPSTAPLTIPANGLMDGLKQEIATENGYMVVWPQEFEDGDLTVSVSYTVTLPAEEEGGDPISTTFNPEVKIPAVVWEAGKKYTYTLLITPSDIQLVFKVMPWDEGEAGEINTKDGSINMSNVTWMNTKVTVDGEEVNTVVNGDYSVYMFYHPTVNGEEYTANNGYFPAQGYFTVNYPESGKFKIGLIPAYGMTEVDEDAYEIFIWNGTEFVAINPEGENITSDTVYFQVRAAAGQDGAQHQAQIDIWFKGTEDDAEWISAYSEIRANYALVIPAI